MKAVSEQEEQELLGTADGGGRGVESAEECADAGPFICGSAEQK